MSRVKMNFNLPVPAQIQKSRDIQTKITGNPNYTTPDPSLAEVKTATDELENAYAASLNNDKEKKANMRIKRKALKALIVLLADYVQTTSGGDETKILSSGFEVRKTPTPPSKPDAPVKVLVKAATHDGELDVNWKSVKGAKSYLLEMKPEGDKEDFKPAGISTKAKFLVDGLNAGTKYWFRVMAVNGAGYSGWSEPAGGRTL